MISPLPVLILLSGFLGSGKTTLLNKIAHYFTKKNKKVAIIINEAGETGVDNLYMKKKGYAVKALFGGCICCTLSANLKMMVEDLVTHEAVDIILMEPSGTADPGALYKPLTQAGYTLETIHHISLVDPTRAQILFPVLEPLFESALPHSNAVILTKTDLATKEMLHFSETMIQSYNADAPLFKMDLSKPLPEDFQDYLWQCNTNLSAMP
ncbi:MAG: GTP-binding protein [Eubacterium sp.]